MITYLEQPYQILSRPVKRSNGIMQTLPGQSATGYGGKIATDMVVRIPADMKVRRVYCTIWSNCGSYWVTVKGEKLFLRSAEV